MRPALTPGDVERHLLNLFASVHVDSRTRFGIRDFNNLIMLNAFTPEERGCLRHALATLVRIGILQTPDGIDYGLTDTGLREVRARKLAHATA
jgi:hypothetical protein